MFRKFDIKIERSVDLDAMSWFEPSLAFDDTGLGGNRLYADLRGFSWKQASLTLKLEESLLQRLESSGDPATTVDDILQELYEEENDEGLFGLDIGVASTVIALSAARCVPFTSCNGGCFSGGHMEAYPLVAFYARPAWIPDLLAAAEESDTGLCNGYDGTLIVYADSIQKMMAFARALISRRTLISKLRVRPRSQLKPCPNKEAQIQLSLFPLTE